MDGWDGGLGGVGGIKIRHSSSDAAFRCFIVCDFFSFSSFRFIFFASLYGGTGFPLISSAYFSVFEVCLLTYLLTYLRSVCFYCHIPSLCRPLLDALFCLPVCLSVCLAWSCLVLLGL
ncbi:hypothetical protein BZA05DRAFT_407322 [Tricharina praecox]|uniref:uncharacterized protein n=1 Tax=Tricharina praecox TaxID=43433 RepID=UPI00221E9187|nr:uncharacterized protein BZA05DRAFT_407322 [Tricharina praecox]KAI5845920.1 hypothetical protein BZA05DRAFT_407322 [Tricharina praecox]